MAEAADAAARRAEDARTRLGEIEQRLRSLRAQLAAEAGADEWLSHAEEAAERATGYRIESSQRARRAREAMARAYEEAARAHEAAAAAHDQAAAGVGDVEAHERLSRSHRENAAADRAAGAAERERLGEE
jgi:hypothetical protein